MLLFSKRLELTTNNGSTNDESGEQTLPDNRLDNIELTVDYFVNLLTYTKSTKFIIKAIADDIRFFVETSVNSYQDQRFFPVTLMVVTGLFIPLIFYLTFKATLSMIT